MTKIAVSWQSSLPTSNPSPIHDTREPFDTEKRVMPGDGHPDRCKSEDLGRQFRPNQDKTAAGSVGDALAEHASRLHYMGTISAEPEDIM